LVQLIFGFFSTILFLFFHYLLLPILALELTTGYVSLIGAAEVDKSSEIKLLVTVTIDFNEVTAILAGEL